MSDGSIASAQTAAAAVNATAPTPADAPQLTTNQVWDQLAKASFAVVSHVNAAGDPRSTGVLFKTLGRRMYIAVAPDSWKAKQIAAAGRVSVTVPVRRGGILALVMPIPPATINFHGDAVVHPAGTFDFPPELERLLPPETRATNCVIEIIPEGEFLTYGIGVPLMAMRTPAKSEAHAPVADASG